MTTLTAPTFIFAHGDTLSMPVTYRNPAKPDGSLGDPIDLTGKEVTGRLFTPGRDPIPLVVGAGLIVTAAAGLMDFSVDDKVSETLTPDPSPEPLPPILAEGFTYQKRAVLRFPTRLQARVRDLTSGDIGTIAIFAVRLFDPATVDLASLPIGQTATVVASP